MQADPSPPGRPSHLRPPGQPDVAAANPAPASQAQAAAGDDAHGGCAAGASGSAPAADVPRLLDKGDETRQANAKRPKLTRAQLRARDEIQYRLATWNRQGYRAFFLTLTSAPDSLPGTINRHFEVLRRRIARYLGIRYQLLEYVRVTTREGHGVIHSVLGVPQDALPRSTILLPFELLQSWWHELHGAFMVNVKAIKGGATDRRKVSSYIVAQYLANQEGAYLRLSQSRCSVNWRLIRDEFRAHAWPNRWDIVTRRNRLPNHGDAILLDVRASAWRKWSWRKFRDSLRDLLGNGVTLLWGYAYALEDQSTLRAHALSLTAPGRGQVAQS